METLLLPVPRMEFKETQLLTELAEPIRRESTALTLTRAQEAPQAGMTSSRASPMGLVTGGKPGGGLHLLPVVSRGQTWTHCCQGCPLWPTGCVPCLAATRHRPFTGRQHSEAAPTHECMPHTQSTYHSFS